MGLFALEHKRLWRSARVWLCVLLCFASSVIWNGVLDYQWLYFGSPGADANGPYGNAFDGYCAIRRSKALAAGFGDLWTDETLQKAALDWRTLEPHPHLQSTDDWVYFYDYLSRLYPELKEPDLAYLIMLGYVDPEALTDFYGRRQDYLERSLEARQQEGSLTGDDVAMLLAMNSRVREPWKYRWICGWDYVTGALPLRFKRLAPCLAIALAFTFSGERQACTAPLLHTTRHGWKKLARVKIRSGLAFAAELYLLIAGGHIAAQLIFLGTDGWDIPIQLANPMAVAPWNMLQAEAYELAFGFLGVTGYAGLVMLLSSLTKNKVLSLVLSLAFVYVPGLLESYLPRWLAEASQYLPLVGSGAAIFGCDVFHLFGRGIWSPYMLLIAPALIGLLCIPLAVRAWSRRQRD